MPKGKPKTIKSHWQGTCFLCKDAIEEDQHVRKYLTNWVHDLCGLVMETLPHTDKLEVVEVRSNLVLRVGWIVSKGRVLAQGFPLALCRPAVRRYLGREARGYRMGRSTPYGDSRNALLTFEGQNARGRRFELWFRPRATDDRVDFSPWIDPNAFDWLEDTYELQRTSRV